MIYEQPIPQVHPETNQEIALPAIMAIVDALIHEGKVTLGILHNASDFVLHHQDAEKTPQGYSVETEDELISLTVDQHSAFGAYHIYDTAFIVPTETFQQTVTERMQQEASSHGHSSQQS